MTSNDDLHSKGPEDRSARPTRSSRPDPDVTQTGATTGPFDETAVSRPGRHDTPHPGAPDILPTVANSPSPVGAGPASVRPHIASPAQMIAGRFLVKRTLGEGGMGRVYAVQDKQIEGRDVALKVLLPRYSKDERFKRLFFQEVRASQKFVSEFVCQVRDTGEAEEGLFLTMDLVDGESLRALLDREKMLGVRHALEITRQVLLGLQSGHEKGFIHRDIKPSNVMLVARVPKTDTNPYGVGARLLDFGIAGLAAEIGEKSRAGTVMYMSPEQAGGERLDSRSDLFAVGVLLFEMLSGRRPFEGNTTNALVQSVIQTNITERLNEIPNLQKPIRKLLERALQKDREKRFQSAGEFAEAIGKSSAYKIPKEVPAWAWVGLAVLGASTGVLGFQSLGVQARVDDLNSRIASLDADVKSANGRVAEERQKADLAAQGRVSELEGLKNAAETRALAAEKLSGEWETRFNEEKLGREGETRRYQLELAKQENDQRWKEESERKQAELSEKVNRLDAEKRELESRVAQIKEENDSLKLQMKPEGRMAEAFDAVLSSVEQARGDNALEQLAEASRRHSVFLTDGLDGAGFLKSLAETSAAIREHRVRLETASVPDFAAVARAQAAFRRCEEAARSLESDSRAWIAFELAGEPQDRLARAKKALETLRGQLAEVSQASNSAHADAWAAIRATGAIDPKAVFAHADSFGCSEHLVEAASQLLADVRQAAEANGSLVLDRLRGFRGLDGYVARLDKGAFKLDAESETDLRLFELAQRWYDDDTSNDTMDWSRVELAPVTARTTDWRQLLRLQWRLELDSDNFPLRAKRTQIYRQTTPKGVLSWRVDRAKDTKFSIQSIEHDIVGQQMSDARDVEYEFHEHRLQIKQSSTVLVDLLSRGTGVSVAPFPRVEGKLALPPTLASDKDLARFQAATAGTALTCLVVRNGQREYWLSPEYGIVADIFDGEWKRELCYATLIP
jgi:hypothetical protein